ncbi:MAG: hypothetical protein AAGF11_01030, partial [Myxococcota bacterium]
MTRSLPTSPKLAIIRNATTRRATIRRATLRSLAPCLLLAGCIVDPHDPHALALTLDDEMSQDEPSAPTGEQDLIAIDAPALATPGFPLQITKSSADIQLDWPDQGPGTTYRVLSCPRPYFAPDDPDVTQELSNLAATSTILSGANDGTTRYYRVLTNDNRPSSIVGQMTIPLDPNFSVLPLCLEGEINDTNALLSDTGSLTAEAAFRWDAPQQAWQFAPTGSMSPLTFELGMSVGIKHPGAGNPVPSTYTWVGDVPGTHEMALPLVVGENNVTMPLNTSPGLMASDILPLVTGGQRLGYWNNAALDYHWYPDDGDFAVPPCSAIRLDVNAPSVFPGCDPASLELGGSSNHNWYSGGSRGAEQGTHGIGMGDCPPGAMVVGLEAYEGGNADWTDGIGVHCREVTIVDGQVSFGADSYSNWYTSGPRSAEQGTHGGEGNGDCPPGQVVTGVQYFEGGNADWVDGIGFRCQAIEWNGGGFTYGASSHSNWYFGGARTA